jgi:GTPase
VIGSPQAEGHGLAEPPARWLPVVAIVGRPNVGKSTLFNRLTRSRDALVADEPGLTRDRRFGRAQIGERTLLLVDTGGLTDSGEALDRLVSAQSLRAMDEADLVLLVVDAREGPTTADWQVVDHLRPRGRPVLVVANKSEGLEPALAGGEFHALGLGAPAAVSAAHGRGIGYLAERIEALLPATPAPDGEPESAALRMCVVGRPNVGKSTLANRLAGEERVIAHDLPGTTRDSIEVPFEHRGRPYRLVDTAGIRRRSRISEHVETISVIRALQAVEASDVTILLLDAVEGLSDQDARLAGLVADGARAVVIGLNKWDRLDTAGRRALRHEVERRLPFLDFAPRQAVSARTGSGVGALLRAVERAAAASAAHLPTPDLSRVLGEAVKRTPPPLARGRRIKLRYAHQGGTRPRSS